MAAARKAESNDGDGNERDGTFFFHASASLDKAVKVRGMVMTSFLLGLFLLWLSSSFASPPVSA